MESPQPLQKPVPKFDPSCNKKERLSYIYELNLLYLNLFLFLLVFTHVGSSSASVLQMKQLQHPQPFIVHKNLSSLNFDSPFLELLQ